MEAVDKYPLFMIASVMFLAEILKIWETIGVKLLNDPPFTLGVVCEYWLGVCVPMAGRGQKVIQQYPIVSARPAKNQP